MELYICSKGQSRIRYNYELQALYEDVDIVTLISVRRLNWIGHSNRMNDTRKEKQIVKSTWACKDTRKTKI